MSGAELGVTLCGLALIGPLAVHLRFRPASTRAGRDLPGLEESCAVFADAFLRALGVPEAPSGVTSGPPEPLHRAGR